jgi:aminoglycoside 3'-phosphotransferase II
VTPMSAEPLPGPVFELVGDDRLVPVAVGCSDASTWRVLRDGGDWFAKVRAHDPDGRDDLETTLSAEADRLRWLGDHVPVPEVVAADSDGNHEWLVLTALSGSDATSPDHLDPEGLVRLLGECLRRFHDLAPAPSCPFDATTDTDLVRAKERAAAGRVDEDDFEPIFAGMTASALYDLLVASRPAGDDDLVVLHGDYCVPNVIVDGGVLSGYVDVGRAGVGDRHRDLGIAARSIAQNFGGHAVGAFMDAYGVDRPDLARLDFFVMLDEFF